LSEHPPRSRRPRSPEQVSGWQWWTGFVAAIAAGGCLLFFWQLLRNPEPRVPDEYKYDASVSPYTRIDPQLIAYEQAGRVDSGLETARALATGPADRIYVGGDQTVLIFKRDGDREAAVECSAPPRCLAVSADRTLYVGYKKRVEVYSPEGRLASSWKSPGERAWLTSIALDGDRVYVADMGHCTVWIFRPGGERVGQIGSREAKKYAPGLRIPSPYFDIAVAPDGLLRVVNPGRAQIEAYTKEGQMELSWGKASFKIDGFIGCCNPSHIAILPDGSFVTSEKGTPRVKIYDSQGEFQCVVAGPAQLGEYGSAREVATDSTGRILVLDPAARSVRIFKKKKAANET
jgi:hypothetical protein